MYEFSFFLFSSTTFRNLFRSLSRKRFNVGRVSGSSRFFRLFLSQKENPPNITAGSGRVILRKWIQLMCFHDFIDFLLKSSVHFARRRAREGGNGKILFFVLSVEMINQTRNRIYVISAWPLVDAPTKITFNPLMRAKKYYLINFFHYSCLTLPWSE